MSNEIKTIDGEIVNINLMSGILIVDGKGYELKEILPIIEWYIKGGLFGHASTSNPIIPTSEKNLQAIEIFIETVSKFKKYVDEDTGNIRFCATSDI